MAQMLPNVNPLELSELAEAVRRDSDARATLRRWAKEDTPVVAGFPGAASYRVAYWGRIADMDGELIFFSNSGEMATTIYPDEAADLEITAGCIRMDGLTLRAKQTAATFPTGETQVQGA